MAKNIKLISTNSYFNIFNLLCKELEDKTSINEKNLIFMEEKGSLMAESIICSTFGGAFNTEVYSFGNFLRLKRGEDKVLSKEGSAMVINTPIIKQMRRSNLNFPDLDKPEPICSPIGVMAISAPKLNSAMPKISAMAEHKKTTVSVVVRDKTGVKFKRSTITVTGSTDIVDSINFFQSAFNMYMLRLKRRGYVCVE